MGLQGGLRMPTVASRDSIIREGLKNTSVIERFWKYVSISEGCWDWIGAKNCGYGAFSIERKRIVAHRFSYALHGGALNRKLSIDHTCRNKACVKPAHLDLVTVRENTVRGKAIITHCPKGHEYSKSNTYLWRGRERYCKTCMTNNTKTYRLKVGKIKYGKDYKLPGMPKAHCIKGHKFTEENVYIHNNKRYCKSCAKMHLKRYRDKKKIEKGELN